MLVVKCMNILTHDGCEEWDHLIKLISFECLTLLVLIIKLELDHETFTGCAGVRQLLKGLPIIIQ